MINNTLQKRPVIQVFFYIFNKIKIFLHNFLKSHLEKIEANYQKY